MVLAASAFGERAEVAEVFQLDGEIDVAGDVVRHTDEASVVSDRFRRWLRLFLD